MSIPLKQGLKQEGSQSEMVALPRLNVDSIKTRIETRWQYRVFIIEPCLNVDSIKTRIETSYATNAFYLESLV